MKYATIIVSALILIAVLIPGKDLPDVDIGRMDKLVHVGMFTLWALAVRYDFNRKPFPYMVAFLAGLAFSAFTEVVQILVEGRTFDVYDLLADALGVGVGLAVGAYLAGHW